MFAKRFIKKKAALLHHLNHHHTQQHDLSPATSADLDFQIAVHYGIPSTASIIAFDSVQRLLAIGTLDGRIKVIGGDNIEGLLISQKKLPYKYLEFLPNQGYLVSIFIDDNIEVWNLESRCIVCSLQWECNITAFSVIYGSCFMYVGDENGSMSVLKYDVEGGNLLLLPYHISASSLSEAAKSSFPDHQTIVGVLPQPCYFGNRILIAYDSGLIILWDVVEAQVLMVRGDKVLDLKDKIVDSPSEINTSLADTAQQHSEEKEITALCWASSDGSILAAGYIDGDILFWKTSTSASSKGHAGSSCNNVVKLQLSSAEKRLPVIVLRWSSHTKTQNVGDGQLFIYGGDEIGSAEVLTVLSLVWSPDMETLRCVGRAELQLLGSFADMILLPSAGAILSSHTAALVVLTSPGQLNIFDHDSLSALASQHEKIESTSSIEYPLVIPTVNPIMTVAKLIVLSTGENLSKTSFEITARLKHGSSPNIVEGTNWPVTGGIANHSAFGENNSIEKFYVAGYEDGSVRIWDATYPVLSLLCIFEGGVKGIEVAGSSSSVSKLDFCFLNLYLAVGHKSGLGRHVFLYDINGSSEETSFKVVTEMKCEAHTLNQEQGFSCRAVFSVLNSPVQALQFASSGANLAVGYECGRVTVLDMISLSISFVTNCLSDPSSEVISVTWNPLIQSDAHIKSPKLSDSKIPSEESILVLTKDTKIYVIDSGRGSMISSHPMHLKDSTVISMYVIDGNVTVPELSKQKQTQHSVNDASSGNLPSQDNNSTALGFLETENHLGRNLEDPLVLLCCKDALLLYHTKSVVQGHNKPVRKVKLAKSCCWAATFKKSERVSGVVVLYQTGEMEVRSLPDLILVNGTSLMSILRWNFKANMEKTMSSTENGQIALANGYEVAFISMSANEHKFRNPESLPCLHDKILAAAAEAAISISLDHKKKKGNGPRILGGLVKGFKGGKVDNNVDLFASKLNFSQLEAIFRKNPFSDHVPISTDDHETTVEINIDDIHIDDEPSPVPSTSSHKVPKKKDTEREQLFDGEDSDAKPKLRTREEIIATYRKAGDASSVAGQARDKLVERQEKLERIGRQTEELQNGAENFASLANELVKVMENRKWWHI